MNEDQKMLASAERRNFLKLTAAGGFTAAMVAGAAGTRWSTEAAAKTANEERDREKAIVGRKQSDDVVVDLVLPCDRCG